jgi:hypothetical protein
MHAAGQGLTMADLRSRTHSGRVAGALFEDRMVITFEAPCPAIAPDDTLVVRNERGEPMEIFPAAVRRDGGVSVWYAPHPLLRHWLGWLEPIDDTHWAFRMEAMHIDILNGIPELCGDR